MICAGTKEFNEIKFSVGNSVSVVISLISPFPRNDVMSFSLVSPLVAKQDLYNCIHCSML